MKSKIIENIEKEVKNKSKPKKTRINTITYVLIITVISLMAFNQFQTFQTYSTLSVSGLVASSNSTNSEQASNEKDLSDIDFSKLKSTGHSIAALFSLEDVETTQDALDVIIPTGTPEYGDELGVSYDDPVGSLNFMAKQLWSEMRKLKTEDPEVWQRYVNLAKQPVGISCEYCCGITSSAIKSDGESACGCQHNPALLALTVWLMDNRPEWSDADVLKEVLKWKALFFPRKMTELTIQVSGMDASSLDELPGMVGGC